MNVDTIHTLVKSNFYRLEAGGTHILSGKEIVDLANQASVNTPLCIGALCFGAVLGWNFYFINRYRAKSSIGINDLMNIIASLAGGTILLFFSNSGLLLAFYGIGLAVGFFLYFIFLLIMAIQMGVYPNYFLRVDDHDQQPMWLQKPQKP